MIEETDYREALRERLKTLQKRGRSLNWRMIADRIPVQYTFLSKCLNRPETHLNEDHLFRVCEILDFLPSETEFILALRARETATHPSRKEFLTQKIEKIRKEQVVRAEHRQVDSTISAELDYLLDPLATLVRTALYLKDLQTNPWQLVTRLGISREQLKKILEKLERLGFIELDSQREKIKSYVPRPLHWGRQHPLMRAHQQSVKLSLLERLRRTEEEDKESFFVTFTMNDQGFDEAKKLIQETLKKLQAISEKSQHKNVYQFSLDFLKVL
ncbi:MAG: DUF4423 domain-containing protein [Bdellovibrionales bacterium]